MMRLTFLHALSLVLATCGSAYAAEISTERTSMPDFCSDRDVTCVLRDGQPRVRAVAPRNSSTAEPSDSPQLVLTPPQAPSTRGGGDRVRYWESGLAGHESGRGRRDGNATHR